MSKLTAAQQRLFDNVVSIAATRLLFNRLHQNFPRTKLDEVVIIHNGQSLPANEREETGEYDVYAAGGLTGQHSKRLTDKPFVVIGRKGSAGKPTYAPNGGWVIDTAYYAQPNDESKLDCKFLFYAISSLDFTSDIISTAIPGINRTSIYRHSIPLPPRDIQDACIQFLDVAAAKVRGEIPILPSPLSELRQIVARIEELAAKIEEARGLRREAGEEVEALLFAKLNEFFSINGKNDLKIKKLADVCDTTSGGTPSRHRFDFFENGSVPWIKSGELKDTFIKKAEEHITQEALDSSSAKIFPKGTLLVALYGANVGMTGILDIDAATNQAVCAVFPKKELLERDYLYWFFRKMRPDYLKNSFGGAQPNISQKMIRETDIAIPPLPEQRRIVAYLDQLQAKVDSLKCLQAETSAELDALIPAVLDKAFMGEM